MDRYKAEVTGLLRDQGEVDTMLTMLRQVRPLFVEPPRDMVAGDVCNHAAHHAYGYSACPVCTANDGTGVE